MIVREGVSECRVQALGVVVGEMAHLHASYTYKSCIPTREGC